jgi:hypothetical protein
MPQYVPILKTATRVLMALAECQRPLDEDVAELQRLAPERANERLDILACHVIQEAMNKRYEVPAAGVVNDPDLGRQKK